MDDRTSASTRTVATPSLTSPAGRAIAGRALTLERADLLPEAPDHLHPDYGGLVVCGAGSSTRLNALRRTFTGVLAEDRAAYEKEVATPDAPFRLPEDALFGGDLDSALQEQLDNGASFAITPTRYIRAGDPAPLDAVVRQVKALRRGDVVVTLAVSIDWLRPETRPTLVAAIRAMEHPVALVLGGQYDPLQQFAAAPQQLRRLLAEVPGTGLWRTDLAGFDALAHGAGFAGIGAGGSLRHLVPAGEAAETSGGGAIYPSVLMPELLRFSSAKFIADLYANTVPPTCTCSRCQGRPLDGFLGLTNATKAAAHAHNSATWNAWLPELLEQPTPADRQIWWRARCKQAVQAHELENARLKQPHRLKPPKSLEKWAGLPLGTDDQPVMTPQATE
ncbi:hypothetical protein AB0K12_37620 [Nonomuraea sp. NPDC049419]|uniref:hypothetical protein n=1 Tax=Nonomuraea sp. NPDC049419 TaxID=3155772 RepID=UPI003444E700